MKHSTWLLFVGLALVLNGCVIEFVDGPNTLTVQELGYRTNYRGTINGQDRFVICDDRNTELTYSFEFDGVLGNWRSYLEGGFFSTRVGDVTLNLNSPYVQYDGTTVRVTYLIEPGGAPVLMAPSNTLESQATDAAIVVVPLPQVIGETTLFVQFNNLERIYEFRETPVIDNCG
jgi:hypothetical protein